MLLAATAVAVATTQNPSILELFAKYLGVISFAYMVFEKFRGGNKEKERELQAKLTHLENSLSNHSDQHKNAHQQREHLVKMNDQRLNTIETRLTEFNSVRHDVELIKAEQKVMATKLDAVQSTLKEMSVRQDTTFKEILELIKKGGK